MLDVLGLMTSWIVSVNASPETMLLFGMIVTDVPPPPEAETPPDPVAVVASLIV